MPNIINTQKGTLALLRGLIPKRSLSQAETRSVAELQANRLRAVLGIDEACFPTESLDLPRIRVEHDLNLPSSGLTYWNGSVWIIVLNASEARTRQRFSLLHEFKHVIDHTSKDRLYAGDPTAAEQVADYFAACVLMPKLYVKRHWGQGPRDIGSMASTFDVSPAAMKYRLDQLGLLESQRRCRWTPHTYQRGIRVAT